MPSNMNWFKYDKKNIEDIVRKFSNQQLDTYPIIGSIDLIKFILFKRIKWISFLDYFDYLLSCNSPNCYLVADLQMFLFAVQF